MERWRWTKTAFDFRTPTHLVYTFQTVTPNYVQCLRCNGKCELWRTHAFNFEIKSRKIHSLVPPVPIVWMCDRRSKQRNESSSFGFMNQWINLNALWVLTLSFSLITYTTFVRCMISIIGSKRVLFFSFSRFPIFLSNRSLHAIPSLVAMTRKSVSDSRKYRTQFIFLALKLLFNEAEGNFVFKVFFRDFSLYVGRYDFFIDWKICNPRHFSMKRHTCNILTMEFFRSNCQWNWNYCASNVLEMTTAHSFMHLCEWYKLKCQCDHLPLTRDTP